MLLQHHSPKQMPPSPTHHTTTPAYLTNRDILLDRANTNSFRFRYGICGRIATTIK